MEEKPLTYCSTLKRAEPQQEAGQYGRELSQEFVLATSSIDLDEDGYYVVRVEENADLRQQQSLFRADAQEGRPTYVNKRLLNPTSSSLDPSLPQKTQQKKEGLAAQDHNYSMLSISTEVPLQKGVKRLSNNQQKLIPAKKPNIKYTPKNQQRIFVSPFASDADLLGVIEDTLELQNTNRKYRRQHQTMNALAGKQAMFCAKCRMRFFYPTNQMHKHIRWIQDVNQQQTVPYFACKICGYDTPLSSF